MPLGMAGLAEKLFAPELYAYNWVKDHLGYGTPAAEEVPKENLMDLPDNEFRFVDYYASSCPHCQHLTPDWDGASQQWDTEAALHKDAPHLVFQKKQCLDDAWKPGPDMDACKEANVHAFPTIKFYGPHGKVADFTGARTQQDLLKFAGQQVGVLPPEAPQDAPEDLMDQDLAYIPPQEDAVVEYYAASCPHCVKLKPTWDQAAKDWDTTHPDSNVPWVQKECLDEAWKPGKDFKECIANDVGSFPTIRFATKGGAHHNFEGPRTSEEMIKFAEKEIQYFKDHPDEAVVKHEAPVIEKAAADEPAADAEPAVDADKPAEVDHADKPAEVDDVKEAGVEASADEDARLDDEAEAPAAAETGRKWQKKETEDHFDEIQYNEPTKNLDDGQGLAPGESPQLEKVGKSPMTEEDKKFEELDAAIAKNDDEQIERIMQELEKLIPKPTEIPGSDVKTAMFDEAFCVGAALMTENNKRDFFPQQRVARSDFL